jgi:hypothetical protein
VLHTIGRFAAGSTYSLWAAHQGDPINYHLVTNYPASCKALLHYPCRNGPRRQTSRDSSRSRRRRLQCRLATPCAPPPRHPACCSDVRRAGRRPHRRGGLSALTELSPAWSSAITAAATDSLCLWPFRANKQSALGASCLMSAWSSASS